MLVRGLALVFPIEAGCSSYSMEFFAYNLQRPEDQSMDSPVQDDNMVNDFGFDLPSDVEEAEPTCLDELSPFFQDSSFHTLN